jgi:Rrf2 family protein
MLNRTVRYALRTLGYLVDSPGGLVPGETIAQSTSIPANYLSKILNQLRKRGVVDSEKGWGGGFRLRPAALELRVRDIVEMVDGADPFEARSCAFGFACDPDHPCALHPYWEQIWTTWMAMLTETRVRDLGSRGSCREADADRSLENGGMH